MSPDLEKQLIERYPKIFSTDEDGDSRPTLRYGIECDDGWYQLIDTLCACIQQHVDTYKLEQVTTRQVKEKFAELRFYYHRGDERIRGMVELAAALSARVCPVCGNPGKRIKTAENWMITRCDEHAPT
ncbi:hypothetical protein [Pseudomonas sp. NA-150]|uniref:hypothetical protein n=1 Tax=Pseudomonas sp. NA-150 TaxID=3367525 RepID=UPI0037C704F4